MLVYLAMIDSLQDKDKFAQIYTEYRDMMLRIARRFFSNEADAEDAVHQAFLKIIDRMDKIVQIDCHKTRSYVEYRNYFKLLYIPTCWTCIMSL